MLVRVPDDLSVLVCVQAGGQMAREQVEDDEGYIVASDEPFETGDVIRQAQPAVVGQSETSRPLSTTEVAAMLAEVGFDPKAEGEYSFTLSNGCTVGFVFDEPSPAKPKRARKPPRHPDLHPSPRAAPGLRSGRFSSQASG